MKYAVKAAAAIGVLFVVAGCYHQDDNNLLALPPVGVIRVVHALPDGPVLRFSGDFTVIATLDYGESSPLVATTLGEISIDVTYTDPAGDLTMLVSGLVLTLGEDRSVMLIVHGSFAAPQTTIIDTVLNDLDTAEEQIEVRYSNATQDSVDIYLTDADELLVNVSPSQTLVGGAFSDSIVALAGDNYRLRVTRVNDATVVYDAGSFIIAAGARRDFTVIESFGPKADDVLDVIIASDESALPFLNQVDNAEIRSLNAVADEDFIDVDITDQGTAANIASDTLLFGELSAFTEMIPVVITAAYGVASDPGNVAFQLDLQTLPSVFYIFVTTGSQANQTLTGDFVGSVDMRPTETIGRVHFVNASESAGAVDVYYLAPGEVPAGFFPNAAGVALLGDSQSTILEGAIDVYVTSAGTTTVLTGPVQVNVAGRDLLLFYITDFAGGGVPVQFNVNVDPAP